MKFNNKQMIIIGQSIFKENKNIYTKIENYILKVRVYKNNYHIY